LIKGLNTGYLLNPSPAPIAEVIAKEAGAYITLDDQKRRAETYQIL
jgi:hypothetical protein